MRQVWIWHCVSKPVLVPGTPCACAHLTSHLQRAQEPAQACWFSPALVALTLQIPAARQSWVSLYRSVSKHVPGRQPLVQLWLRCFSSYLKPVYSAQKQTDLSLQGQYLMIFTFWCSQQYSSAVPWQSEAMWTGRAAFCSLLCCRTAHLCCAEAKLIFVARVRVRLTCSTARTIQSFCTV